MQKPTVADAKAEIARIDELRGANRTASRSLIWCNNLGRTLQELITDKRDEDELDPHAAEVYEALALGIEEAKSLYKEATTESG
jgi:aspartate oxidase